MLREIHWEHTDLIRSKCILIWSQDPHSPIWKDVLNQPKCDKLDQRSNFNELNFILQVYMSGR